jgi:hypothetical protein
MGTRLLRRTYRIPVNVFAKRYFGIFLTGTGQ